MLITEFSEIALVQMKRQGKTMKDLARVIGTTDVYARNIVNGTAAGPKASEYRQMIANDLGIALVQEVIQ